MVEFSHYRPAVGDVEWEGAVNARRVIGPIYRMGRREWLTTRGWEQLRAAGVDRIIDLRNPGELRTRPRDPRVPAAAMSGIDILQLPLEEPGHARFDAVAVPYMNHPSMYRLVCEEFPEQLREVLTAVGQSDGAVVLHCSAGRDRSGLVASLLLDLAGHRERVQEHDALATRGINEWHRVSGYPHPYESYQESAQLQSMIDSRASALEEFMDWLGPAQEFIADIGVPEEIISRLRARARVSKP